MAAGPIERAQAPETASGRRLSPWRVAAAGIVVVALLAGGVVGFQWWSARAAASANPWFAAYVDVTATPSFAFDSLGSTSTKDAVLSFIVSSTADPCVPSWGTHYTLAEASGALDLDRRIARLQQQGGTVAVSFGGQRNEELAVGCTDESKLKAAYAAVVDRYKVSTIDLDLEGDGLVDKQANARRAAVIAQLQQERRSGGRNLAVWVTLPVGPGGMTQDATDAIATLLAAKVDLAGVNLMTMDYGTSRPAKQSMASVSEDAMTAAQRQLGVLYDRAGLHQNDSTLWSKLGATPMIGQNDSQDEVFSLRDASAFDAWATSHGLGRMSMWSANRDHTCGSNYVDTVVVSTACSGVDQGKQTFAGVLSRGFDGRLSLGESQVTTAEPMSTAVATDDPAHSPYAIWSPTSSYLKDTKVVWHHNVYQAKWWTQGDVPDSPVLNAWETSWQLIGPVMPGETPIPQPTLPAGLYPAWDGRTAYEKGQRVLFDGTPFVAKWWTQGDSPEAASSSPDSSPWTPLTQDQIDQLLGGAATK